MTESDSKSSSSAMKGSEDELNQPVQIHQDKKKKLKQRQSKTEIDNCKMSSWFSCEQASQISAHEVQTVLRVDPRRGLDTADANRRREIHGLNAVGIKEPEPIWKKYLDQFNNPLILLLLASAVISIFMKQIDDAVSITIAIVIVVTVGFVQEYRSEKTLERMGALLPPKCHCMRDGQLEVIYAKYLVPGDVVHLTVGDRIPADLRLIQVNELSIDESSFTGETEPKYKTGDQIEHKVKMTVSDMANIGFQGTLIVHGSGVGIVVCTGEKSQFGEVFKMMQAEEPPRTPLQKNMDTLGKQLSIYSFVVIGLIMTIGWAQGRPILDMFNVGVSLAVAAIPEGLPIVVTVTLAFGVMRMARRNAIVKRLPTVEALGCVDWICSDKTGTLTTNELKVSNLLTTSEVLTHDPLTHVEIETGDELEQLMEVATVCNNCAVNKSDLKGAPIETALMRAAFDRGFKDSRSEYIRMQEIPFSAEKKMMVVKCVRAENQNSNEFVYFVKGAPEFVAEQCKFIASGNKVIPINDQHIKKVAECVSWLGEHECKRVLAFARGNDMSKLAFVGLAAFLDPPRPLVRDSIQLLDSSGVRVCMITGDSLQTAKAISGMIGLHHEGRTLISGNDIDKMNDRDLELVTEKCYCFYRTTPRHKVRIVKALQSKGHIVAMTGDGVNDGVAIKKADVGVSMGVSGTDVCKEAADMILLDDNFNTILNAIEEGKCIFYNIQNFVRFQLSTSISALMLISLSTLLDIPNPLNPMQILWINVIMDGPPAQSLGLEPVDHEVLKRPPRSKKEQILSRGLIMNVLLSASIIIAGTLWVFKETMEDGKMTPRDTTMTFTCFVFFDMFNALSSRSQERLIWEIGLFSNKFFLVAVTLSILGQLAVIYLPPLQYVFQTESLALEDLLLLICLSSSVFIVCEGKKFFARKSKSRKRFAKNANHLV